MNHLNTKFLARRSDIIVSSTLSITLTPSDDEILKPFYLAKASDDDLRDYIDLRSEYRAYFVRLPN